MEIITHVKLFLEASHKITRNSHGLKCGEPAHFHCGTPLNDLLNPYWQSIDSFLRFKLH